MQCSPGANHRRLLALALTATVTLGAAQESSVRTSQENTVPHGSPRTKTDGDKNQLTEIDCRVYAQAVVKAAGSGKVSELNALIDWDSLFTIALAGVDMAPEFRRGLRTGFKRGTDKETSPSAQIVKNCQGGGRLDYLRTRSENGRQVILFRLIFPEEAEGVSYFEFLPRRSGDGKIRAHDIFQYSTAEFVSSSIRHALLPVIADQTRGFLEKLVSGERDYVRDFPFLKGIAEQINNGDSRGALVKIKALRPETQKDKTVLLLRLQAAQAIDDKEYSAVLEEIRALFPKDPCLDLLLIDYYLMRNDFRQSLASVDRLDKALGGDPYLNVIRGGIVLSQGDRATARKIVARAIDEDPTLESAYFTLIGLCLQDKDYDATLELLKMLNERLHVTLKDLSTVPAYAGFIKSTAYQRWLDHLKKRPEVRVPEKTPSVPAARRGN